MFSLGDLVIKLFMTTIMKDTKLKSSCLLLTHLLEGKPELLTIILRFLQRDVTLKGYQCIYQHINKYCWLYSVFSLVRWKFWTLFLSLIMELMHLKRSLTFIRPPLSSSLSRNLASTTLFKSLCSRRPKSLNIVDPPERTTFCAEIKDAFCKSIFKEVSQEPTMQRWLFGSQHH